MKNMDLRTLIVAELGGIGMIQLIMWIVVLIRHSDLEDVQLDLRKADHNRSCRGTLRASISTAARSSRQSPRV